MRIDRPLQAITSNFSLANIAKSYTAITFIGLSALCIIGAALYYVKKHCFKATPTPPPLPRLPNPTQGKLPTGESPKEPKKLSQQSLQPLREVHCCRWSADKSTVTYNELLENADAFEINYRKFPTPHNHIRRFEHDPVKRQEVEKHANSTRPIVHPKVTTLIEDFIKFKRAKGTDIERAYYNEMDVTSMLTRLLTKRPLMFMTPMDVHTEPKGMQQVQMVSMRGMAGTKRMQQFSDMSHYPHFKAVGTPDEKGYLTLDKTVSYDELAISPLISVSVPTHFINTGSRNNRGEITGKPHQEKGIYTGAVGARFENPLEMESKHMLVSAELSTPENGYGANRKTESHDAQLLNEVWTKFYDVPYFPSFEEVREAVAQGSTDFVPTGVGYLNVKIFKERLRMTIEPFILDANLRAKDEGKKTYLHLVGLGLGVWAINKPEQGKIFIDVVADTLRKYNLSHISDLDFSHFNDVREKVCGGVSDGEMFDTETNHVRIHFSRRDPADPLNDESKLLVAMYAWDGGAYPGNEYWGGQLTASGDPAAACCSDIPTLQNPHINTANVLGEKTCLLGS